jgi:GNAT superfamily N-acetyltransferase
MSTEYRRDYGREPGLLDRVFPLLDAAWPGMSGHRDKAALLGSHWTESTPFVFEEDGEVIGHVGVLELPYVLEGTPVRAAGIHAVTTREDRRGKGVARALLAEAVEYASRDHETLVLFADIREVYEPHGFRVRPRHRFIGSWSGEGGGAPPAFRLVDKENPSEVGKAMGILARRIPISERLGVGPNPLTFGFFAVSTPLWMAQEEGILVAAREGDGEFILDDVVAAEPVDRDSILAGLGVSPGPIRYNFSPDLLDPRAKAERLPEDEDLVMVRGHWVRPELPVDVPISGWC